MIGLGTLINTGAILAGGLAGLIGGKILKPGSQDTFERVCGISVLFIGTAGAMQNMLSVSEGKLVSGQSMLVTLCLVIGTFLGELLNIEGLFERFGSWLQKKTGSKEDNKFVQGFLTASLTVSIGAMAIVGSIQDGILGDWSVLAAKAVLDFVIIFVMTCSMGKGCIFSALPVFVFQGTFTLCASLLKPIMTEPALANISLIGSILIFCVGINLVWGKKLPVANMVPAVILGAIAAYIPF